MENTVSLVVGLKLHASGNRLPAVHNCGFVKVKEDKKKKDNWRLIGGEYVQPTIVLNRGNGPASQPSAGSRFCFSYTELRVLNRGTPTLRQLLVESFLW